ncbi:ABC-2 family transporter protein [Kamptonema cortianum]|nr:ABC-2 family transporter protein [Kamptonema cortianum]MDL5046219.1 ABC-2 family transporter protein [Oscillatoria amoena NRMC-F 0135]
MERYLKIYQILLRNSLIREMNFAANFWGWLICEALWFAAQIALIEVVFLYTDSVAGWNKWQVVMLYGTHHLTSQLFQAVCFVNLANVPELIRTGKMDFLLLQPINAQFAASTKQFGFDNLVNAMLGVAFVVYGCHRLEFIPSAGQMALYVIAVCFGIMIHYALTVMLVSISFWVVKAQGALYAYYNLMNLARYPDAVFRSAPFVVKTLLTFVIPVMIVANVPTRLLNDITTGTNLWLSSGFLVGVSCLMMTVSVCLWNFALSHYTSASS